MGKLKDRIVRTDLAMGQIGADVFDLRAHTYQGGVPRSASELDLNTDLDDVDIPGFYSFGASNINKPLFLGDPPISHEHGILFVVPQHSSSISLSEALLQFSFSFNNAIILFRKKGGYSGGTPPGPLLWEDWKPIQSYMEPPPPIIQEKDMLIMDESFPDNFLIDIEQYDKVFSTGANGNSIVLPPPSPENKNTKIHLVRSHTAGVLTVSPNIAFRASGGSTAGVTEILGITNAQSGFKAVTAISTGERWTLLNYTRS